MSTKDYSITRGSSDCLAGFTYTRSNTTHHMWAFIYTAPDNPVSDRVTTVITASFCGNVADKMMKVDYEDENESFMQWSRNRLCHWEQFKNKIGRAITHKVKLCKKCIENMPDGMRLDTESQSRVMETVNPIQSISEIDTPEIIQAETIMRQVEKPAMLRLFTEANTIINGQRRKDYGPVKDSFTRIAGMWGAYLGVELDEMDVADMMIIMKTARSKSGAMSNVLKRKRDNYRDIVGYAGCAEMMDGLAPDNEMIQ